MRTITVVGLGYVGLPLACLCAEKDFDVYGADIDKNKVSLISQGISPIGDPDLKDAVKKTKGKIKATDNIGEAVKNSSIVIVCAPTPVDDDRLPNLRPLKSACEEVSKSLQKDTLVIIESTIFPGTTYEIILPILKKSNVSFYLSHCPERLDPGNKKFAIQNIPRVVGGINNESTKKAAEFYQKIIDADIIELSSVKAAEATKIMENTFRDINIAFINEMAMSFDKEGIDILEVIKGASTKPFAFMPHYPGAGVGGHCIPVDPYYLIEKAKQTGFSHKFLSLAREINNNMSNYTVKLLEEVLQKLKKTIKNAKIGVLGLAYKADVDDVRESPAFKIIKILKKKDADVFVFDPYVKKGTNVENLNELLQKSDYIILVTAHNKFKNIDLNKLKENNVKIVIDGRNCLDKEKIKSMGIMYHGIGRS
ncbi:MAG TPA: nucleotide sugar dehydrogenase [Candidatus Woesearchaeota archaeon]|jgi:nucleotide sugar dehydrogenase|nr:nucleotide sugar dehydrogenase [Candidatus Woesearchaeota archaeon]|tara:strand:+ start:4152 stop:5420 length:1269 start_codon:yes stop_codon:yes gene_type:complete